MTDQQHRNLELTEKLYELTGSGDWDAVAEMLTADFFITEAPGLPYEGVYKGRNALKDLFIKVMGMVDARGLDRHQMTAGGDWVVVLLDILAGGEDGSELRISLAEAIRFRDDLICEIKPYYFDPLLPHRAAAAKRTQATA